MTVGPPFSNWTLDEISCKSPGNGDVVDADANELRDAVLSVTDSRLVVR